jgi:dipeptidyl aminopeptidase/acylaminoacyl peptidase
LEIQFLHRTENGSASEEPNVKNPDLIICGRSLACFVISILTSFSMIVRVAHATGVQQGKVPKTHNDRAVTVVDTIEMTQFGDPEYLDGLSARYKPALFSPDGNHFVVVTRKGSIKKNTNDYSLLLFQANRALRSVPAQVLVSLSSSSNRPAIHEIKWVDDSTVAFLGENPGELQQVYKIDCKTRQLARLTNHPTGVISYAIAPKRDKVFFLADPSTEPILDERSSLGGVVISTQRLVGLLAGEDRMGSELGRGKDLLSKTTKGEKEVALKIGGNVVSSHLWLSPNGHYLIVNTSVVKVPESWTEYESRSLRDYIRAASPLKGSPRLVNQYELIDLDSGKAKALLDAPTGGAVCGERMVMWSPDSRSVIVAANYLPLNVPDIAERSLRQSKKMTAEIKIPGLEIVPITTREACPLSWDRRSSKLLMESTSYSTAISDGSLLAFQKAAIRWEEVELPSSGLGQSDEIAVTLEEDMNTPPKLFIKDQQTGRKSLLLDFNPQFKDLKFGSVQNVTFKASDGRTVSAGVYLPADYEQGKRYPLVIQTHGWDPHSFWINGYSTSAFAAQPLAGRGFVVLQFDEDLSSISTPGEALSETSAYESGIDYLDKLGLVDRDRVGVIGFSRSGLGVEYALTHSKYHFAAATLAEPSDGGYFAYLSFLPSWPWRSSDFEEINGGLPFGDGLASWMKNSPGFNLAKVTTPVRTEVYDSSRFFLVWEWFAGLSRLRRPVELVYIPDGAHVLVRPRDRLTSQQGNVDWFSFWLQGYEDPDPAKAEQYRRWRELRRLQEKPREAERRRDE